LNKEVKNKRNWSQLYWI